MKRTRIMYAIVIVLALAFPYITPDPDFWISSGGTRALWLGVAALSMSFLNRNLFVLIQYILCKQKYTLQAFLS
jgi:hypothetical protein